MLKSDGYPAAGSDGDSRSHWFVAGAKRVIELKDAGPRGVAPDGSDLSGQSADVRPSLTLRAGDWVEVRSAEEILATLDSHGCLDGLPFMPEMLQFCGRRFRVYKSAHKTCDTIQSFSIRRMDNAVHLEGLRCDGQGHGGCEASCLLFWKEAWLTRVSSTTEETQVNQVLPVVAGTLSESEPWRVLERVAQQPQPAGGKPGQYYRCQATELRNATTEIRRQDRWMPGIYLRDLRSRNVGIGEFVWYGVIAVFNAFMIHRGLRRYPHVKGLAGKTTPTDELDLQPGELVEVRSKKEIMATLNAGMRNRGLWFDVEQVPFCGSQFRVLRRVRKILDEKTGRMITLPNACVILDGVICGGKLSYCRMFCPRSIYPYWHEVWLKRPNSRTSIAPSPGPTRV
jgi:hypothetical protein